MMNKDGMGGFSKKLPPIRKTPGSSLRFKKASWLRGTARMKKPVEKRAWRRCSKAQWGGEGMLGCEGAVGTPLSLVQKIEPTNQKKKKGSM